MRIFNDLMSWSSYDNRRKLFLLLFYLWKILFILVGRRLSCFRDPVVLCSLMIHLHPMSILFLHCLKRHCGNHRMRYRIFSCLWVWWFRRFLHSCVRFYPKGFLPKSIWDRFRRVLMYGNHHMQAWWFFGCWGSCRLKVWIICSC